MLANGDGAIRSVGFIRNIGELHFTDDELGAIGGDIDDVC